MIMTGLEFFEIIAWFLFSGYVLFLLINTINWLSIPKFTYSDQVCKTKISIIIAMRNEEANIISCLQAISEQNYSSTLFEVIVVDDHSSDNSISVVKQFSQSHKDAISIFLLELKEGSSENRFKKMAISEGIKKASGELIITTDADCIAGKNWLKCIASYYEKYNPVFTVDSFIGPVHFRGLFAVDKGVFRRRTGHQSP